MSTSATRAITASTARSDLRVSSVVEAAVLELTAGFQGLSNVDYVDAGAVHAW